MSTSVQNENIKTREESHSITLQDLVLCLGPVSAWIPEKLKSSQHTQLIIKEFMNVDTHPVQILVNVVLVA